MLYEWFEPKDVIERIDYVEAGHAGDRERIDYRFLIRNPDGPFIVEQRAYFDVNEAGRISYMRTISRAIGGPRNSSRPPEFSCQGLGLRSASERAGTPWWSPPGRWLPPSC